MNYKTVCRTAPATPGLSDIMTKKSVGQKKFRYGKNVPNSPKQLEPVGLFALDPKY